MGDGVFLGCNATLKLLCEAEAAGENWAAQWHNYGYSNSSVVNYLYVNYSMSRQEFDYWSTLNSSATVVEIAKGITTIPAYAFNGFTALRTVTMPESLTTIQARAFYDLNTLSSVSFGFGVTTIRSYAFYNCTELTELVIKGNVTCTEAGIQTAKCDHCDATDTKELTATGHDLSKWYVITTPTCTTAGENGVTCPYCGLTQAETVDPLGHSFTNYVPHGNATCEADGTWSATCDHCGIPDTQVEEGSALGHSFTNYVTDGNTTCTEDGTNTWTSGVLGYSLGAYCASQASKGGTMGDLAMATAVYGYHAKAYFG